MSDEQREPTVEEKEKMRKEFEERIKKSQEIREKLGEEEEKCPHGIYLSRTCIKCDTVQPDQIQQSIKLT